MEERAPVLTVVETVRCLECGEIYAKPSGGGTARSNPGCPRCGYVGWLSTAIPFSLDDEQPRFGADRLRRRLA